MALLSLSNELILLILSHTDVPELLSFSRTCHRHRTLSLDPILHAHRLHTASYRLSFSLLHRPSLSSLLPPISTIYLSTTHVLARRISGQLVSIRLSRNLSRRPSASSLVKSNILPPECCRCDKATGEVLWGGGLAPRIVEAKRRVERERIKDGLRAWLVSKADAVRRQASKVEAGEGLSVRGLVRRFTGPKKDQRVHLPWDDSKVNWQGRCEEPTRAHVYGLRRFWEGMAHGKAARG